MSPRAFVTQSHDHTHFELEGRPFYFCGTNCYYLMTRAADPSLAHEVTYVLDAAATAGLTVVRTWAFNEGAAQWNALQTEPGVFCERVFRALDWVVAEAGRRGLRVLLDLTNYWPDYGGMLQYVRWSRRQRGLPEEGAAAEEFYTDEGCRAMFRCFVAALLARVNTCSGVPYSEDPAILGWALANEPRCCGDLRYATVRCWAAETAAFIKERDPHHLLALDCEGFFGPSTPGEAQQCNPYDCSSTGCDFLADCASPHIDFACCHMYPDLWLPQAAPPKARLHFAVRWLEAHARLAALLGKPLVLTEFGKRAGPPGSREAYFREVLGHALLLMCEGAALAGTIFWMTAAPSYPDYDGFTIYLPSVPFPPQPKAHEPDSGHQAPHKAHPGAATHRSGSARMRQLTEAFSRIRRAVLGAGGAATVTAAACPAPGHPQLPGQQAQHGPRTSHQGDDGTVLMILEHAARVAELNRQPSPSPAAMPAPVV